MALTKGVAAWLILVVILVTGCSDDEGSSARVTTPGSSGPTSPTVAATSIEPVEPPTCPNPYGGDCLGKLSGKRYRTETFTPRLTYTGPAGWSNMEDLPGQILLLPPGRGVLGVDPGNVDYLGVSSGTTVAAADCEPVPMPGVGLEPEAIVTALAERPGLDVSAPRKVVVGGRRGLAVDIEWEPDTRAGCKVEGNLTIIPLIIGVGPASLEHSQIPGLRMRLYVLDNGDSNIVIEVSDVENDARPFQFEPVVRSFRFAPA